METERKLKIGVVGGAGYTAGELLRIIMGHPKVKVDFVYSTSSAGKPLHLSLIHISEPTRPY